MGLRFSDQDIYVNVAGGMRLAEPGIDLALACALFSARSDAALPEKTALVGELSLAGEIRPVRQMRRRSKACAALGFARVIGPAEISGEAGASRGKAASSQDGSGWTQAQDIKSALRALFGK
jgi:DNA repair protein RadA/Sms